MSPKGYTFGVMRGVGGIADIMPGHSAIGLTALRKGWVQAGEERLIQINTGYNDLHSKAVDVDFAEIITNYETASGIYPAGLDAIAWLCSRRCSIF